MRRRVANRLTGWSIPNIGTLGVLRLAAVEGLVDLPAALEKLRQTNFRAADSLIRQLIVDDEERARR